MILTLYSFLKTRIFLIENIFKYLIIAISTLSFLVCAADIPYFNQFFSRFSISAFQWVDTPMFVISMIAQEFRYWFVIIPFLVLIFFYYKNLNKIFNIFGRNINSENNKQIINENIYSKIGLSILFLLIMLIGIRGRIDEKSPIRIGTAFFCNNAFLNQLGLNPNFTLIRSYLDSKKIENQSISLIDEKIAILNVQNDFGIKSNDNINPIKRKVDFGNEKPNNYNVVLIIMESMSAGKMTRHGNKYNLTPFLDSISNKGYYFENTYSSGIHTINGVFSTLFSFPALFRQLPMKENFMFKYDGIFSELKKNGYDNIYFTTHDGQFDNIEGFLRMNDCENTITKVDYPSKEVKTTLGVPDDYMFRHSIPILNKMSNSGKPFLATFMTASDHGPYYVPKYFKPKSSDIKQQIVEYADYSLNKFINLASKQTWFDSTIFVFVADHGVPLDNLYELSLDYNHIPLLFYAPKIIKEPRTISDMAGQIDVFPTIMGLLKAPYSNNTLGIDLFKEKRDYIYFNADDKFGVINREWLLIVRDDKSKVMYNYKNKDLTNRIKQNSKLADSMEVYAKSNLQTFQYVINNKRKLKKA